MRASLVLVTLAATLASATQYFKVECEGPINTQTGRTNCNCDTGVISCPGLPAAYERYCRCVDDSPPPPYPGHGTNNYRGPGRSPAGAQAKKPANRGGNERKAQGAGGRGRKVRM